MVPRQTASWPGRNREFTHRQGTVCIRGFEQKTYPYLPNLNHLAFHHKYIPSPPPPAACKSGRRARALPGPGRTPGPGWMPEAGWDVERREVAQRINPKFGCRRLTPQWIPLRRTGWSRHLRPFAARRLMVRTNRSKSPRTVVVRQRPPFTDSTRYVCSTPFSTADASHPPRPFDVPSPRP